VKPWYWSVRRDPTGCRAGSRWQARAARLRPALRVWWKALGARAGAFCCSSRRRRQTRPAIRFTPSSETGRLAGWEFILAEGALFSENRQDEIRGHWHRYFRRCRVECISLRTDRLTGGGPWEPSSDNNLLSTTVRIRHLAIIGLGLLAADALTANDTAAGRQHEDPRRSPVEYLAHIPRLVYVNSILISPGGATVATLRGENTSWNQGGKPLTLQVWSVPGGGIPMQPNSGAIQLWRAKNGRFLRELTAQTHPVWALAASPDGQSLAVAQQGPGPGATINLWGLTHDKWRGSFGPSVPSKPGRCVMRFAHGGLLLAGVNLFQQVEVKLWNYPGNQAPSADDP
jgi:hypothetical protein